MADRSEPAAGLTVGTAGHIDHGKTALVEALTGTATDRLAEERRRGITIELGFAELDLGDGRSLGVVDVPDHERLVRTMVAGACGIDMFLLVVAADDGLMPQTQEHLTALRALGVERGVVALNKIDLAEREMRELAAAAAAEAVPGAKLIEVSARTGEGIEDLRRALAALASEVAATSPDGSWPPEGALVHVDRSFSITGAGTVVTGTIAAGSFEVGDRVSILPSGERARVRGIQRHGREVAVAGRGQRAAINLAGVGVDEVSRGDVLAGPGAGVEASYRVDGLLLGELEGPRLGGRRLQAHHGTRDVPTRVVDLGEGLVQLRLESPLMTRAGNRIVLREIASPSTLGGVEVVDPDPGRHGSGEEVELLTELIEGEPEQILATAIEAAPAGLPADPDLWANEPRLPYALGRFERERWIEALATKVGSGQARREKGLLLPPATATAAVGGEERAALPDLSQEMRRVVALLRADGLEPRAPGALAAAVGLDRGEVLPLLAELAGRGDLVKVKADVFYEAARLEQASAIVVELARRRGSISLAELRDALHTSRKYSQAILEHLDGRGLLIRQGDRHLPRSEPPSSGSSDEF